MRGKCEHRCGSANADGAGAKVFVGVAEGYAEEV